MRLEVARKAKGFPQCAAAKPHLPHWLTHFAIATITGFCLSPINQMKLRVLYHGHCFDGVASAATFTRFYSEQINDNADVQYGGLLHRPGNLFDENMFDGDENAIVDFKYSPSDKLTWWFDHHQSAFLTPATKRTSRRIIQERSFWIRTA